ncbi:TlpA disulfide reductase family protein [Aequorivita echinoideorum]|uniref:TlpA family protein disulfide reductase n=1 Tax=Aequorivita echinoideorum TaxID=1549647 RepID=A0ABS5S7G0_9FLAO|nr:TlpA disulfide reductase family protein [Aequorivita echinoideorum]MBT0609161.1 TlpA family protein disulfide reductase [Aequorivita echinoideorum]
MRRIFALFITLSIIMVSCKKDTNTFELKGEAIGFADGTEILVYTFENKQPKVIDTITIQKEKFSATYPKKEGVDLNFLRIDGVNGTIIYFPENADLKAKIYKDSINASRVTGGAQNDAYSKFASEIASFTAKRQQMMEDFKQARQQNNSEMIAKLQADNMAIVEDETKFKKKFLEENNNTLFAVMLISEMVSRNEISPSEASEFVQNLSPKIASSEITTDLKENLAKMQKADVGSMAPAFSAPTPSGKTLSLKDAMGKYTIIDFWASWCKPCRMENPNVVNVYNKYHDKGLNIISVSLDKAEAKDKWLKAIEDDKMDWYHVSNLQFWQDPIAQMYSVRSIPATFLLDENGMIIDKNLRGPALEQKIASLLGE